MTGELIYTKQVDKSVLYEGLTIPNDVVSSVKAWYGEVERRSPHKLTIRLCGVDYVVTLTNVDFDRDEYADHCDVWQIRYSKSSEFAAAVNKVFHVSALFIKLMIERKKKGSKAQVKVPDELIESFSLVRTEDNNIWEMVPKLAPIVKEINLQLLKRRQTSFEEWYNTVGSDSKRSTYLSALAHTKIKMHFYRLHPIVDNTKSTPVEQHQDLEYELYPQYNMYQIEDPTHLCKIVEDAPRQRFADDGSFAAAVSYYIMWLRLEHPETWQNVPMRKGDDGRIDGLLERGYDYEKALKEAMKMVESRQLISYGAPGTGKSNWVNEKVKKEAVYRTTFHPDTDYASFVGAYKPTMGKSGIEYTFCAQTFTKAYKDAWLFKINAMGAPAKTQFLVIEEINRGNCAQIFGDLFQLLDRKGSGYSTYPVSPDSDISKHLHDEFGKTNFPKHVVDELNAEFPDYNGDIVSDIKDGKVIVLPPNLYIWATMNTSDQSLFPIDSAFKRRWDWKYVPIKDAGKKWTIVANGVKYDWWDFLKAINTIVYGETQSADKQLGYFFVKLKEGETEISATTWVNKVAFYLWNDVFKDCELTDEVFKAEGGTLKFTDFFKKCSDEVDEKVVSEFLKKLLPIKDEKPGANA